MVRRRIWDIVIITRFPPSANGAGQPTTIWPFTNGSMNQRRSQPTFGIALCAIMPKAFFMLERFFGPTITISTGRIVPVRLIGEQHVREDLGFIPGFADWVRCIRPEPWMGRAQPIHRDVDPFAATG